MRLRLSNIIGLTLLNTYLLLYCSVELVLLTIYVFLYYFPKFYIDCALEVIKKSYPGYSLWKQIYWLLFFCLRNVCKRYSRILRTLYRFIRRKNADYCRYYCRNIDDGSFE